MTFTHLFRFSAVAVAAAAIFSQSALAGGEPKNQWPFTRPISQPRAVQAAANQSDPVVQGEPKNEQPFTRHVATIVVRSSDGFSWTDGAIGAIAGIGLALSGAGVLTVARKTPRTA
jgi:hypothetical protein